MAENDDLKKIIQKLSPLELKVFPHLAKHKTMGDIVKSSKLSQVEVMRALQWLQNKGLIKLTSDTTETVALDENGKVYLTKGLPEKRLLAAIEKKPKTLKDISSELKIEGQELNACIGMLKSKAAIELDKGMLSITENGKKILIKETLEEQFLKRLKKPLAISELVPEEKFALDNFRKRKQIIKINASKEWLAELHGQGIKLIKIKIKRSDAIEKLTPEMLKSGSWKNKEFRRFDVNTKVPKINGGRIHFVNQAIDYGKRIWLDMGFSEMKGPMVNTSFWNFDALFTAQDHPVRELQDTFYIKEPKYGNLPDKKLWNSVKDMHEKGGDIDSTGWMYSWIEDEAKKNVLRTHTTVLSALTLSTINPKELPMKFFSFGHCFRNEALDWSHLFEFNQTEGIVIDPDANFRHLLGYLKEFFRKMGFPEARFRPAFFPYTEPSVEIDVWHSGHNKWMELGGAGIFRPEVVKPLLGEDIPVLAWGPGFDRIILEYYGITDIRDLYRNDLKQIREMKAWMK